MRHLSLIFSVILVCTIVGCGPAKPKKYPVSGTVKIGEVPLADGKIVYMTADGAAPDAGTIKNGSYSFESLPGKKKVEITATREVGAVDPAMGAPRKEQYIAPEFNTETTLEAEVTAAGPNKFDFKVTEKK